MNEKKGEKPSMIIFGNLRKGTLTKIFTEAERRNCEKINFIQKPTSKELSFTNISRHNFVLCSQDIYEKYQTVFSRAREENVFVIVLIDREPININDNNEKNLFLCAFCPLGLTKHGFESKIARVS